MKRSAAPATFRVLRSVAAVGLVGAIVGHALHAPQPIEMGLWAAFSMAVIVDLLVR